MRCMIYRWLISRILENEIDNIDKKDIDKKDIDKKDKRFPGYVKRHMERCHSCRTFAKLSRTIPARLNKDAKNIFNTTDSKNRAENLSERVTSALQLEPNPRKVPAKRHPRRVPVLVPAMAVFIVVIITGYLLNVIPGLGPAKKSTPTVQPGLQLPQIAEISDRPILASFVNRVESPIKSEMNELEQEVESAAKYVFSCLDPQLDQAKNN